MPRLTGSNVGDVRYLSEGSDPRKETETIPLPAALAVFAVLVSVLVGWVVSLGVFWLVQRRKRQSLSNPATRENIHDETSAPEQQDAQRPARRPKRRRRKRKEIDEKFPSFVYEELLLVGSVGGWCVANWPYHMHMPWLIEEFLKKLEEQKNASRTDTAIRSAELVARVIEAERQLRESDSSATTSGGSQLTHVERQSTEGSTRTDRVAESQAPSSQSTAATLATEATDIQSAEDQCAVEKISIEMTPVDLEHSCWFAVEFGTRAFEERTGCAICLSSFKKHDVVRLLPCEHIFHRHCIDLWLRRHTECPLCKHQLFPIPDMLNSGEVEGTTATTAVATRRSTSSVPADVDAVENDAVAEPVARTTSEATHRRDLMNRDGRNSTVGHTYGITSLALMP